MALKAVAQAMVAWMRTHWDKLTARKRLPPLLRKHIKYSRNRRNGKRINLKQKSARRKIKLLRAVAVC